MLGGGFSCGPGGGRPCRYAAGVAKTKASTREWRAIARGPDVLFHICSRPEKRGAWTPEEFYASGRSDWEDFVAHWRHVWPELGGTCVEIGCGAGRLTHVLAETFERVVAVDVSDDMIARAREASPQNAEFHRVDGSRIPLPDGSADGVFSVHVFQHLEDDDMMREYLAEARRVLRPGGSFFLHITTKDGAAPLARRAKAELKLWRSRLRLARGEEHSHVRMNFYDTDATLRRLDELGFEDVQMRTFRTRSDGDRITFFTGRVPPA